MRPIWKGGGIAALVAGLALACADGPTAPAGEPEVIPAPFFSSTQAIPDRYIIVFNQRAGDPDLEAGRLARLHNGRLLHTYRRALRGFAVSLPPRAVEALRRLPIVAYVEADQVMTVVGSGSQENPTWGLDRIDETDLPLDNT